MYLEIVHFYNFLDILPCGFKIFEWPTKVPVNTRTMYDVTTYILCAKTSVSYANNHKNFVIFAVLAVKI